MPTTDKIDLCKAHKDQYATPKKPTFVTVNEATYLAVVGRGAPGGPEFSDKVGELLSGEIQQIERGKLVIMVNKFREAEAIIPYREQSAPREI